jgi:hypothetical protein
VRTAACLLFAIPSFAHVVSISTGDGRLEGNAVVYELRMPLFEAPERREDRDRLPAQLRFRASGGEARLEETACAENPAENAWICKARYVFESEPEIVEIESALPRLTVPNHVHIARLTRGARSEQAVLDLTFPRAEIRFRPPTAFEEFVKQSGGSAWRVWSSPVQWLFLLGLALAAAGWGEALLLLAAFAAGESAAAVVFANRTLALAPRFLEMAGALTIAYLAVEILFLPRSWVRWLIVAVLGVFHGLGFAQFLAATEYKPGLVLGGAVFAASLLAALLYALARRCGQPRFLAWLLLATGLSWFAWRFAA